MDELTEQLCTSFAVSSAPNTTAAAHPRWSQYKSKSSGADQETRRQRMLQVQKRKRFDYVNNLRMLKDNKWEEFEEDNEDSPEEDMEVEQAKLAKPGRYYKNQLMLSEWMVEVPDNFETDWIMVPCPVGKRTLVVASHGSTCCYTKSGYCLERFPSRFPGGCKQMRNWHKDATILDCIYSDVTSTFYVIDVMCWKEHTLYESETDFRFYWLATKFTDVPEVTSVSGQNRYKFEVLPNCKCEKSLLESAMATKTTLELDGLLFYHKMTHYTFGSTPLVTWLKPYMLPELLGVRVPDQMLSNRPASYTTFSNHVENTKRRALEKETQITTKETQTSDSVQHTHTHGAKSKHKSPKPTKQKGRAMEMEDTGDLVEDASTDPPGTMSMSTDQILPASEVVNKNNVPSLKNGLNSSSMEGLVTEPHPS